MAGYIAEIALEEIEFFAHHGYYAEERVKGNRFTVTIKVTTPFSGNNSEDIDNTVNYEGLYEIAEKEMQNTHLLLETVSLAIIDQIFLQYSSVTSAEVSVSKHNPPVKGSCARSKVTLKRSR